MMSAWTRFEWCIFLRFFFSPVQTNSSYFILFGFKRKSCLVSPSVALGIIKPQPNLSSRERKKLSKRKQSDLLSLWTVVCGLGIEEENNLDLFIESQTSWNKTAHVRLNNNNINNTPRPVHHGVFPSVWWVYSLVNDAEGDPSAF